MRAALVLFVLSGIAVGCNSASPTATSPGGKSATGEAPKETKPGRPAPDRTPVAKVTAIALFEEYGKNPLAADNKYKGKYVEVSGSGQVKQAGGGYSFGFEVIYPAPGTAKQLAGLSAREQEWFRAGAYPPNVVARLNSAGETAAAKTARGTPVQVVGRVAGSRTADAWKDYVVELEDCSLTIQSSPKKP